MDTGGAVKEGVGFLERVGEAYGFLAILVIVLLAFIALIGFMFFKYIAQPWVKTATETMEKNATSHAETAQAVKVQASTLDKIASGHEQQTLLLKEMRDDQGRLATASTAQAHASDKLAAILERDLKRNA